MNLKSFYLLIMKKGTKHIIFLLIGALLYGCSYASPVSDSLPACFLKMKQKDNLLIVREYDYKGQQWFGMRRMLSLKESQTSDRMYHLEFYNKNCKLVCTQTKGGIAGLNKVLPDTIDKTKIIKIAYDAYKRVQKKVAVDTLPAGILKMKQNDSLLTVDEYDYKGEQWFGVSKK